MAVELITIKKRSTFVLIRQKGKFLRGKSINIQILEKFSEKGSISLGYIATKRIGNAVKRNKAKRILREISKKVIAKYGKINSYYVLIAKHSILNSSMIEVESELKKLIL